MTLPNYFLVPERANHPAHLATALAQFRDLLIREAIKRNGGSLRDAARDLGIGYSTIKLHVSACRAALKVAA